MTTILFRPVGPDELALIAASGYKKFPPRRPDQPIFYPVMNEQYAIEITTQWNVPAYGKGYVTRFAVNSDFLLPYPIQNVGGVIHNELWIPAEELEKMNENIVGEIEIIREY
ncbi:hypothetical protein [Chitinophaga solisilvae]|uniref:Uncharacterized protein n=1 Tax=Chitinophaga solisilvae TaxID=1233460 RepID=A0A3S1DMZ9_9BACT|nr:hypothetical protein [Chitinophaga solisilvae]NSL87586.1 hypothetical protein [Chitinophaga solisilvae]